MSLTGENLVGLFSCNENSRLYLYVHKMVIKGNQTQMSNKKARSLDLQGFLAHYLVRRKGLEPSQCCHH